MFYTTWAPESPFLGTTPGVEDERVRAGRKVQGGAHCAEQNAVLHTK